MPIIPALGKFKLGIRKSRPAWVYCDVRLAWVTQDLVLENKTTVKKNKKQIRGKAAQALSWDLGPWSTLIP